MNFREIKLAYDIVNVKSFNVTAVEALVASMFTKGDAECFVRFFKENNIFSDQILYNI